MTVTHDVGEPKIGYFDTELAVQEQVFRLEVTMHDHVAMAVLHARNDLLKKQSRLLLLQTTLFYNVVKKLARLLVQWVCHHHHHKERCKGCLTTHLDVFHYNINILRCLNDLIQTDDVGVIKQP